MKLGLGLCRRRLTRGNHQFARPAGATPSVAHRVDCFRTGARNPRDHQPAGSERGWDAAGDPHQSWSAEELIGLQKHRRGQMTYAT